MYPTAMTNETAVTKKRNNAVSEVYPCRFWNRMVAMIEQTA
jgi:hypothetical protein